MKLEEMKRGELFAEAKKWQLPVSQKMTNKELKDAIIAASLQQPLSEKPPAPPIIEPDPVVPKPEKTPKPPKVEIQLPPIAHAPFVQGFLSAGVPKNELAECYQWAFGYPWEHFMTRRVCSRWNGLHEDIFKIELKDMGQPTLPLMQRIGTAYMERAK